MASADLLGIAQRHAAALTKLVNADLQINLLDENSFDSDTFSHSFITAVGGRSVDAEGKPKESNISTKDFTLKLEFGTATIPAVQLDAQRKRLEKEREQLERNIANSKRQLADETFLGKAPDKVVASIRAKLADYEAQLAKME